MTCPTTGKMSSEVIRFRSVPFCLIGATDSNFRSFLNEIGSHKQNLFFVFFGYHPYCIYKYTLRLPQTQTASLDLGEDISPFACSLTKSKQLMLHSGCRHLIKNVFIQMCFIEGKLLMSSYATIRNGLRLHH